MKRALELVIQSVLIAAIVLGALILLKPWEADVSAAVAVHAAEPLDVNDRIIVRTETAEGVALLPPREVALWQYVWEPQMELSSRISRFENVTTYFLTDAEMRGHLVRHGVTEAEIDHLEWYLTNDGGQ